MLRILVLLVIAAFPAGAAANAVGEMRVIGDAERTRFVVDLQKNPDYRITRLANPYRLVIDLPEVEFPTPAKPGKGRGLISDFRYGLIAPGKARIVLDLSAPVTIVNSFVLDPVAPEPARLVVDVAPTSAESFEAAVRQDRPEPAASLARLPFDQSDREAGRPVVVLDPGHGGIDSGAIGKDNLMEKEVTLRFGQELARELKQGGKVEAVLTREGDDFLSLGERVEVARQHEAALFISIHADTVKEDYVRGATVYTLSDDASDALAAALAARENRSDILAGLSLDNQPDEVVDILFDLARRETKNLSVRFAKSLVDDIDGAMPLNANPWRRGAFVVLKAPDVPSVLLELGYLSNPEDESAFRSKTWPKREAEAVARSIEEFFTASLAAGQ